MLYKLSITCQNQQNECVHSKPGHLQNLIRVFDARSEGRNGSKLSSCGKIDSGQTELVPRLSHLVKHRHIVGYLMLQLKVCKGAKIRNQYNQVPHLPQDTNGKVTNSQLDTTNESQEGSPFPAGDHKVHINRCAQRHSKP